MFFNLEEETLILMNPYSGRNWNPKFQIVDFFLTLFNALKLAC
jgi:hypothetical protein